MGFVPLEREVKFLAFTVGLPPAQVNVQVLTTHHEEGGAALAALLGQDAHALAGLELNGFRIDAGNEVVNAELGSGVGRDLHAVPVLGLEHHLETLCWGQHRET